MAEFSLLIPHDDRGDAHRNALAAWTEAYWRARLPEAEVIVAGGGADPPNRSANRNLLARMASTDLLAFIDADAISSVAAVRRAVAWSRKESLVKFAGVNWVSARATKALLAQDPTGEVRVMPGDITHDNAELWGLGFFMRREVLEAVGGWDERFVGWGHEDPSLTMAVNTLVAPMVRIPDWCFHLWHPRETDGGEHDKTTPGFLRNRELGLRYRALEGQVEAMRELIGLPPAQGRQS